MAAGPFASIRNGRKVIESRLYDEKRRAIGLGDEIVFRSHEGEELTRTVAALYRYPTFEAMFADFEPGLFGGESAEALLAEMRPKP